MKQSISRDLWSLRLQKLQSKFDQGDTQTEHSSQLFSSQSEGESTDDERAARKTVHREGRLPHVLDGICLCYISLLLLRIPIMVKDFDKWISNGDLPYYGAIRELDPSMRRMLPGPYHSLLDPRYALKSEVLHIAILEAIGMFQHAFGLSVPTLNHRVTPVSYTHLTLPTKRIV